MQCMLTGEDMECPQCEQQALQQQVMQLTPAQLAQLPPDRRAKIEALRARIAQGLVPGAPPQPTAADINML